MKAQWIDLHTHLDELEISDDQGVLNARQNDVNWMITIGTNAQDHAKVIALTEKYPGVVFGTLGVHPHEASNYTSEVDAFLRANAVRPHIVGIGEIGLDYFYNKSNHEDQKRAFTAQMQVAADLGLPVELHMRDADEDAVAVLESFHNKVRGVLHCFTGTAFLAAKGLELGYDISISGIVTFKNAENLREIVRTIPLDRLHVETDAPFLAPAPHRGKKNQPAFVIHTGEFVAQLKGVDPAEFSMITRKNAERLFPKLGALTPA